MQVQEAGGDFARFRVKRDLHLEHAAIDVGGRVDVHDRVAGDEFGDRGNRAGEFARQRPALDRGADAAGLPPTAQALNVGLVHFGDGDDGADRGEL